MRGVFLVCLNLLLLLCGLLFADDVRVLEMMRQPEGVKPDILYLAPRLTQPPKAYTQTLATTAPLGTVLPNAPLTETAFCGMGPLSLLEKVGYRLLPIRDVSWKEAAERLDEIFTLRRKTRYEDGIEQSPLCVTLCEDVSPEVLKETLPRLLSADALILLAPQDETLPVTVIWENRVWPTQRSEYSLRVEHWVATFADIAGLPPPVACGAVSVLPLLTGSGYQRPVEQPILLGPTSTAFQKVAPCTMICTYTQLPSPCPWVPDFTDQSNITPTMRFFVSSALPIPAEEAEYIKPQREPLGLYIRTACSTLSVELPPLVSCVIRVKGYPVFSVWQSETPQTWQFANPETQIVEFFLVLPPKCDPLKTLPFLFVPRQEKDQPPLDNKRTSPSE